MAHGANRPLTGTVLANFGEHVKGEASASSISGSSPTVAEKRSSAMRCIREAHEDVRATFREHSLHAVQ